MVLATVNARMDDCGEQNMVLLVPCPSGRPLAQCCNVFTFGVLYKRTAWFEEMTIYLLVREWAQQGWHILQTMGRSRAGRLMVTVLHQTCVASKQS